MKRKRILSLSAAVVLGLGALAGFAGCDTAVTDAETRKKVLGSIAAADLTGYEYTESRTTEVSSKNGDTTYRGKENSDRKIVYLSEKSGVSSDYFSEFVRKTKSVSPTETNTENRSEYDMSFTRGDDSYSTTGAWKDSGVKYGNFNGLAEKLKSDGDRALRYSSYASLPNTAPSAETFIGYETTFSVFGGKITKKGNRYTASVDIVDGTKRLLFEMRKAVDAYEKNPNMTVREFFVADSIKKMVGYMLSGESAEEGFVVLRNMVDEATGRYVYSDTGYYSDADDGEEAFYSCLGNRDFYAAVQAAGEYGDNGADISSKDGTVGGMKASVLLGSAAEVKEEIGKAAANPEKFLLEESFGFKNGEKDTGTLKMTLTATVLGDYTVAGLETSVSLKTAEYTEEDVSKQSANVKTSVKLLKNGLKLTDLTGMKVDMGKRLKAGTYTLTAKGVTIGGRDSSFDSVSWTGDAVCTATASETGLSVAVKFTAGSVVLSDTRTYTYGSSSLSDYNDFFYGARTVNGKEYNLYGISYHFSWYSSTDAGEISLGSYSNVLKLPDEQVYKTL